MFIEKLIYELLKTEPFFANFLLGSSISYNNPRVQTAAVSILKGTINFYFNTAYMESKSLPAQKAILKHEILHVLLEHCGGSRNPDYQKNHMAKNVAMDCAINQYITDLPEGGVTLASLEKMVGQKLQPYECWEYYYDQMKQKAKENGPGDGEPHDHDIMFEGEGDSEAQQAQNKAAIKDLANKAASASAGNVPEHVAKLLGSLNKDQKVNWKQQLRNLVASARSITRKPTRKRANRRFELEQPGHKKDKKLILGVCFDVSGSVSDESLQEFFNEAYHLAKQTTKTYLIQADCEINKVELVKNGKAKPSQLQTRYGSGGTAYQPAIDKCMELDCDAIIYFGDMDAADVPKNPKIPFIWVRVGSQPPPGNFGKVIDLC